MASVIKICDDRSEEPSYAGVPMSTIVEQGFEICILLCTDHGPCVSGAHNTIIIVRVGKDLVSSLVSGLLTIGPRFGGTIDDVARYFQGCT